MTALDQRADDTLLRCACGYTWAPKNTAQHACPACKLASRTPTGESLAASNPRAAAQWDYLRNGVAVPKNAAPSSRFAAHWVCDRGHTWIAEVRRRTRGSGCPACGLMVLGGSLAQAHPDIAAEWDPLRNGAATPELTAPSSTFLAHWVCDLGHAWTARVNSRAQGRGCPTCARMRSGLSLAQAHPDIAAQWHPSKNGRATPHAVAPSSRLLAHWLCPEGHEWSARVYSRSEGRGCPTCAARSSRAAAVAASGSLVDRYPKVAAQWHPTKNGAVGPSDVTPASGFEAWWKCSRGHTWKRAVHRRIVSGKVRGCAKCLTLTARKSQPKRQTARQEETRQAVDEALWLLCAGGHTWRDVRTSRCPECSMPRILELQSRRVASHQGP